MHLLQQPWERNTDTIWHCAVKRYSERRRTLPLWQGPWKETLDEKAVPGPQSPCVLGPVSENSAFFLMSPQNHES